MNQNNQWQNGYPQPYNQPQFTPYPYYPNASPNEYRGDPRFRPLGAWEYFLYTLLFSIPIAGFILLIVFSFNDDNINRRNFARSHWCVYLVIAALVVLFLTISIAAGGAAYGFR